MKRSVLSVTASRRPAPDIVLLESALTTLLADGRPPVISHRSSGRALALLVALVVIPALLAMAPTGNVLNEPGPTPDVRTWIHLRGAQANPRPGRLLATTVHSGPEDGRDRIRAAFDQAIEVVGATSRDDVAAARRSRRSARAQMTDSAAAAIAASSKLLALTGDERITLSPGGIGGPSAGLMIAIAIVELLGPLDLTRGRVIAGTGTISPDGDVGEVGGVRLKAIAAARAGAAVFLVPASQASEARAAAHRMLILEATDLAQAVRALAR